MKPRIQFCTLTNQWVCHINWRLATYGYSPNNAYVLWLERKNTITHVPRAGIWNRKDVNHWYFEEACKPINYYLDNKLIIGYHPPTDQLILQG